MNTNVKLSENEFSLVTDAEIILTKNRIISKVYDLFGELCENYKKQLSDTNIFPDEVMAVSPKIYKGEQFLQLPYVLMDYPRFFAKDNLLAVRSFFWWGNFFSITFLISGKYLQQYLPLLLQKKNIFFMHNWYLYTGDDAWQHNVDENNCVQLKDILENKFLRDKLFLNQFVKIVKKIPLLQWNLSFDFFINSYGEILKMLKN